jgi:hypothetical protein
VLRNGIAAKNPIRYRGYYYDEDTNSYASVIFGVMYGLVDGAASLTKYAIKSKMFKPTTAASLLVNY